MHGQSISSLPPEYRTRRLASILGVLGTYCSASSRKQATVGRHVRQMGRHFGAVGRRAAGMCEPPAANTALAEKLAYSTTVWCCEHNRHFPLRFEVAFA